MSWKLLNYKLQEIISISGTTFSLSLPDPISRVFRNKEQHKYFGVNESVYFILELKHIFASRQQRVVGEKKINDTFFLTYCVFKQ